MEINYSVRDGKDFEGIPENYFDIVTMNMVIHYIEDLDLLFSKICKCLKIGGKFVFTIDHPYHALSYADTTGENRFKEIMDKGRKYTTEKSFKIKSYWGDAEVDFFSRPLMTYVNKLNRNGLYTSTFVEPPTIRAVSYEDSTILESPIPFKMSVAAKKLEVN